MDYQEDAGDMPLLSERRGFRVYRNSDQRVALTGAYRSGVPQDGHLLLLQRSGGCVWLSETDGSLRLVRECPDAQAIAWTRLCSVCEWDACGVGQTRPWKGTPGGMRRSGVEK